MAQTEVQCKLHVGESTRSQGHEFLDIHYMFPLFPWELSYPSNERRHILYYPLHIYRAECAPESCDNRQSIRFRSGGI
eukprot:scaffold145272_cov31-Prasinocladus_malaysianus.AAC.1